MGVQIYVNYLEDGGYHLGVSYAGETQYVRTADGPGQKLPAYVDVILADSVPQTWESIDTVVEEALGRIGSPYEQTMYIEATSLGQFSLLTRPSYPKTAEQIKNVLRWAWNSTEKYGRPK